MNSLNVTEMHPSIPTPVVGHSAVQFGESGQITIFCYENEVPPFVKTELERIYNNFFSTLTHISESCHGRNISTYVVLEGHRVTTIFLFAHENGTVRVLNEVIKVKQAEVSRFSNFIFSVYGSVDIILFHAVDADPTMCHRPYQRINCLEDIVLTLPALPEEYFNQLGKSTRKTIKGYSNKLKRDFPSLKTKVYEKGEADEQLIRTIIEFNRASLLTTGKISVFNNEASIMQIIKDVNLYGMVYVATIDGEMCAGSISYKVGNNYFMHISGHDSRYNSYRLGVLFRYLTICECIRHGGSECHFLWGRQEFKFSLLGVQRDLHDLVVYRSKSRFLLQSSMAFQNVFKGLMRQAQLAARAWRDRASDMGNFALRVLHRLVNLNRSA